MQESILDSIKLSSREGSSHYERRGDGAWAQSDQPYFALSKHVILTCFEKKLAVTSAPNRASGHRTSPAPTFSVEPGANTTYPPNPDAASNVIAPSSHAIGTGLSARQTS